MGGVRWRSDDADWVFLASRSSYTLLSLTASGAEAAERNPQGGGGFATSSITSANEVPQ